MIDLLCFI